MTEAQKVKEMYKSHVAPETYKIHPAPPIDTDTVATPEEERCPDQQGWVHPCKSCKELREYGFCKSSPMLEEGYSMMQMPL